MGLLKYVCVCRGGGGLIEGPQREGEGPHEEGVQHGEWEVLEMGEVMNTERNQVGGERLLS